MAKKKSVRSKNAKKVAEDPVDFEASLAEVEQIVVRLEGGELNLTDSLEQYELGIRRLKQCHRLLEAAEQRVSLLAGFDADGNPIREPMPEAVTVAQGTTNPEEVRDGQTSSDPPSMPAGAGPDAASSSQNASRSVDAPPELF